MILHKLCPKCETPMEFVDEVIESDINRQGELMWTVTPAHFRCPNCATTAPIVVIHGPLFDNIETDGGCKHPRLDLKDGVATCTICKKVVWNVLKDSQ